MMSIQQQLRRQWLISLLALMLPLLLLADYGVRQMVGHYVLSRLQHDADSLIAALQRDPQSGEWQLQDNRLGTVYQRVYSGHYYSIRSDQILLKSRSLWGQSAARAEPEQRRTARLDATRYRHRQPPGSVAESGTRHYRG